MATTDRELRGEIIVMTVSVAINLSAAVYAATVALIGLHEGNPLWMVSVGCALLNASIVVISYGRYRIRRYEIEKRRLTRRTPDHVG